MNEGTSIETNVLNRFWKKVDTAGAGGCWIWLAGCSGDGYGAFRLTNPRRQVAAHRYSYEVSYGPIPDDMQVRHDCDNPKCVNPEHLVLGTHEDNMRDKSERKRVHADRNPNTHLTWEDVRLIRMMYPRFDQPTIAALFGIKRLAVGRIIRGVTWKE